MFKNKTYDVLKWVSMIAIPAITTFLATILPVVGVSAELANTIIIVIGATGTLLGALLGISCSNYNKDE